MKTDAETHVLDEDLCRHRTLFQHRYGVVQRRMDVETTSWFYGVRTGYMNIRKASNIQ